MYMKQILHLVLKKMSKQVAKEFSRTTIYKNAVPISDSETTVGKKKLSGLKIWKMCFNFIHAGSFPSNLVTKMKAESALFTWSSSRLFLDERHAHRDMIPLLTWSSSSRLFLDYWHASYDTYIFTDEEMAYYLHWLLQRRD